MISIYEQGSGSKLNPSKTKRMWLGSRRGQTTGPVDIRWITDQLKLLGIYVGSNQTIFKSWTKRIDNLESRFKMWKHRSLSLAGKVLILNTLGLSALIYLGTVSPIPKSCLTRVNTLVFNFLWSDRNEMIKRDIILFLPTDRGGLGFTDLTTKLQALLFKSIRVMTRETHASKWVFLARYWIGRTIAKHSNLWAFLLNSNTPHCEKTRNEKPIAYQALLATVDILQNVLQDLNVKQFAAKATYQALLAQKQIKPKAEQQWQALLSQPLRWPVIWAACHKGLNTGHENEVSYLAAHRVVKTAAYLKFKCGMRSISEFCIACGQIEDLEHVFISCKITERVWKEFTPILKKIMPGEAFSDTKVLLLRHFQNKRPKRATQLATYLMRMILHKLWIARCTRLFDKKQRLAEDIIRQIKAELKQRTTLSFNTN